MAEDSAAPLAHPVLATLLPRIPHHGVRITSQAKMTHLIAFALSHLSDPTNPPIAFHTLPPPPSAASAPGGGPSTSTPTAAKAQPPAPLPSAPASKAHKKPSPSSAAALPKLVSIAEIVKRSYVPRPLAAGKGKGKEELPEPKVKGKGKGTTLGLYQYSRLGALEDIGLVDAGEKEEMEEERMARIALDWVESGAGGRKRPRKKHTPYMLVVLSTTALPLLEKHPEFTYQPPVPRPRRAEPIASNTDRDPDTMDVQSEPAVELADGVVKKKRRRKNGKKKAAAESGEEPVVDLAVVVDMAVDSSSL